MSRLVEIIARYRGPLRCAAVMATMFASMLAAPTVASAAVTSRGGVVESHPEVFEIFWGNNWTEIGEAKAERPQLEAFYERVSESSWQGVLTQYWQPEAPARPEEGTAFSFVSSKLKHGTPYVDTRISAPTNVTYAALETEVKEAIENNKGQGWPQRPTVSDQFVVLTPPGSTVSNELNYCGVHPHGYREPIGGFVYAFLPWEDHTGRCRGTAVAAHEYAEAVTDPVPYPASWRNQFVEGGGEVADLCEREGFGTLPGTEIEVPKLWDNHEGKCVLADASPPMTPPQILTETATTVTQHEATLHGSVTTNGLEVGNYWFKWGTSEAYGQTTHVEPGGNLKFGAPKATITGLSPNTTYHYRLVLEGAGVSPGILMSADREFKTAGPPIVTTEPASDTNTFEPQLNAGVNPNGADTHYQFEYGKSTSYGTKVPVTAEDIGSGTKVVAVAKTLSGLERNTTYHFRVVASNEVGTTTGSDQSFTTLPPCKGAEAKCVWSLQSTRNPEPTTEDQLEGVSCASSTMCMAVGADHYTGRGFAETWNGTEWKIVSTTFNELKAVSCPSATWCMAVAKASDGSWRLAGYELGKALFWSPESEIPPVPTGATQITLSSVSCSSTTACTAVGSYYGTTGGFQILVERWNGTSWSQQTAVKPAEEGEGRDAMRSVSCPSATSCTAVGKAFEKPFAERWNGNEWSLSSVPNPSGATRAALDGVSCTSSSSCMATGYSSAGGEKTLAERWNGTEWTILASPNPTEATTSVLRSVSCLSASSCFAVGIYVSGSGINEKSLAESWNGSEWALQASPTPTGSKRDPLESVSCTSSIACTAVGSSGPGPSGETKVTLGERYE